MKKLLKKYFYNYYFLSFVLGALAYYLFLAYSQMAGGKYILLEGDTLNGTVPTIMTMCDNILHGKGISYTWSMGLGINSYINLAGISFFNVSTLFYLLLNNVDYTITTIIVLVLKAGITSLFFYIYMDKIWNVKGVKCIIFAVCYAMCAYWVVYIPAMLAYADAIYMLPVILYLISEYASNGKYKLMCLAYLYLFLNFYYTGYIVGFFSLFYLILYMCFINRYTIVTILKKLFLFGACIVLTAGITAIILYPAAYFIMTKYAADASQLSEAMEINILDIYNQLFIGQVCGYYTSYPYIYCGLPALLLCPLYFINKKINKNEKLVFAILLSIMIVSCIILPLYLFWHCMDAPDGDPYRFSFIISFIMCVIAAKTSDYLFEIKKEVLFIAVLINVAVYIACMYIQPIYQKEFRSYPSNNWLYFMINAGLMLAYLAWVFLYRKNCENSINQKAFKMIIVLLVMAELIVNARSGYYKEANLYPKNNEDTYRLWKDTVSEAVNEISDDESFYRISSENDYIINAPLFFNYNGISTFTNMENYEVRKAVENLGLLTSPKDIFCNGLTDFTRMILAVGYEIKNVGFGFHNDYVTDFDQHAEVIKNDYKLSLGFLVNEGIIDFEFPGRNQFDNINAIAECMTGEKHLIYDLNVQSLQIKEEGIRVVDNGNGVFSFVLDTEDDSGGMLVFMLPYDSRDAYIQFDYGWSAYDKKSPIICDAITGVFNEYERLSGSFIKQLTRLDDGFEIAIFTTKGFYTDVVAPINTNIAFYNKDEFIKVYNKLCGSQLIVDRYDNGYVHGTIDVIDDNKVLFTSIPYDEGWEVYVNGEKTQIIKLLDDAFIGVALPKGRFDVEFKYHVPGLKTGMIISVVSLILMMILFKVNIAIKTNKRKS